MSEKEFFELSLYLNKSSKNFKISGGQMPCRFREAAIAIGISFKINKENDSS